MNRDKGMTLLRYVHRVMPAGRKILVFGALSAFMLWPGFVWAEGEPLPDRFMLRLGGYRVQNAETIVRLDSNQFAVGTYIDFAETLGGETEATVGRLDGYFRFNENHAIGFSWYDLKFTGQRVLSRDIVWGDVTYPVTAQVDSELRFDVYKLNYRYSLHNDEKVELGVSAGLHVMRAAAAISAQQLGETQSEAVTAPLPEFGIFAQYRFTPRFSTFFDYQAFFISYQDKFRGGLQDFILGFEYRLLRHLSLGAAYNRFALNAKLKGDTKTLYLDTNWNGGMLYGALYF